MYQVISGLTLSDWKDIATILTVAIALLALLKGVFEFVLQSKQRRATQLLELHAKLDSEDAFKKITNALDDDPEKLRTIPPGDKRYFLALFEEAALLTNSGLIPTPVAHYMFGYYSLRTWASEEFWENMQPDEKNTPYWALFKSFVEEMRDHDKALKEVMASPKALRSRLRI